VGDATFLMRNYASRREAGAVTGHVHLIGGIVAPQAPHVFMSRPTWYDPRRVLWTAGGLLDSPPSRRLWRVSKAQS